MKPKAKKANNDRPAARRGRRRDALDAAFAALLPAAVARIQAEQSSNIRVAEAAMRLSYILQASGLDACECRAAMQLCGEITVPAPRQMSKRSNK